MDQQKPKTARSYRGALIDDNYVLSLNIKWLGQICLLIAGLVYGYWQIEVRIKTLENEMVNAHAEIENLLSKFSISAFALTISSSSVLIRTSICQYP